MASMGSPGGLLLFGEEFSVENLVSSVRTTASSGYLEMDLTRAVDKWSVNSLVGAEPGYIGHSPEGSEFSRKLAGIVDRCREWSKGHEAHQPCPVVVFRNIHRASPEVQQLVERLATAGELPLPSGDSIKAECILVLATAPGIYPPWDSRSSALRFMESTVHPAGQRLLFDPAVASNFFPMVFPPPSVLDFVPAASMQVGQEWASLLPAGRLIHRRFAAGPALLSRILRHALSEETDGRLQALSERISCAAREVFSRLPNATLPSSMVVPARWCVMVEEEEGEIWAEACPVEEIADNSLDLAIPPSTAESLGISVPPIFSWNNPSASGFLEEKVIGQGENTADIAEKISLFAASPKRGRALFSGLLLGPTGTGKTHLAKTLASAYGRRLVKIDCSTLQDESLLQEAIFGFGPESLASQLAIHRASVVLLDEIDKAHRSVWFLLMQALDEGVMKSSIGREDVCLEKSVVLATSNQLAEELSQNSSQFSGRPRQDVDAALRSVLRSCVQINEACVERFDAVYYMAPLKGDAAVQLWAKILGDEFGVRASSEVVSALIAQHGDILGASGARAVKRACAEITSRAHEWGMSLEKGSLVLRPDAMPLSRRQKLWLRTSENRTVFQSSSTHPWVADLIQEVFIVNAGKTSPKSPQASIMLVGPTGSGKTHLPQELSRLMGKGEALMVDCGSLSSLEEAAAHLFGEPSRRRGHLTESLIHQPDRVVVFDEMDKAPHGLMDQLLGVLDQGRALDRHAGIPVDMRQAAFFFTSNALSKEMQELCELVGDPSPDAENPRMVPLDACLTAARLLEQHGSLRPEHLSRLDLVIPFGLPSESGIIDHSMRVVEGVLEEYGLDAQYSPLVAKAMPPDVLTCLDSRTVKREASRIAAEISRKKRQGLAKDGQSGEDPVGSSVYEKFGKKGMAVA